MTKGLLFTNTSPFMASPEERSDEGPEVYLVERFICNEEVGGSTPPRSTIDCYFVRWLNC